ncbi:MAG: zinc metalloprotease HtpX [Candidatus Levybacteria bacterium]|nr:zinc metalloprotease HtpX [Candidatus Levybacteria bacterium]
MSSYIKTILLLGFLSVILITFGRIIGGVSGMYSFLIIALVMNGVSYFFSDKIALMMSRAKPLSRKQAPGVYEIVENLTHKMKLPMPKLYITPDRQANAFATGRDPSHASVAVTQGIMEVLDKEELKAVLAHELSHVKNRDILIATIAAVLASAISFIGNMVLYRGFYGGSDENNRGGGMLTIFAALLVPLGASLIQLAISRQREFGADETGAETIGTGKPLADALIVIHDSTKRVPMRHNPAFSSLYIENPFGRSRGLIQLFSTHPPVAERVARLRQFK